jgi:NAD(P)-dependent dehydrogenase (short-subunit alcohol dehydrogenase family)
MRLSQKIAIVTGAASGIGRATAQAFAREGAKVALCDLSDCSPIVAELEAAGGFAIGDRVDVSESAQVKSFVRRVVAEWGGLDIIFNNAGVGLGKEMLDATTAEFDHVFAVNVRGVFNGCQHAIPEFLRRGGGSIVNMSSSAGLAPRASDPVYSASKHAVIGLTQSIALAYATANIRANAVCPGPIDTPMFWAGLGGRDRREYLESVVASCPAARLASVDDVANSVVFLASDEATFLTGAAIPIDGGKAAGIMPASRYRMPKGDG